MKNHKSAQLKSERLDQKLEQQVNEKLCALGIREKQIDIREKKVDIREKQVKDYAKKIRRQNEVCGKQGVLMWTAISSCCLSAFTSISLVVLASIFYDEIGSASFLSACGLTGLVCWTLKKPIQQLDKVFDYYFPASSLSKVKTFINESYGQISQIKALIGEGNLEVRDKLDELIIEFHKFRQMLK